MEKEGRRKTKEKKKEKKKKEKMQMIDKINFIIKSE